MRAAWPTACVLVLLTILFSDAAPINGDAAVYAHQALSADLWERPTHVAYVAALALGHRLTGLSAVLLSNLYTLAACVVMTGLVASRSRHSGWSAWFAGALLLPYAAHGEVDMVWMALVLAWLWSPPAPRSHVLYASAIAVSPLALLVLPYGLAKKGRGAVAAAAVAVVCLTVLSTGDWWFGARGVLEGAGSSSLRLDWLTRRLPIWCLIACTWRREYVLLLPLLFGPSDQPSAVFPVLVALQHIPRSCREFSLAALAMGFGVLGLAERADQLRVDTELVELLAAEARNGVGVVAPWSIGVRASMLVSGSPYGMTWRPIKGFVRDQAAEWCSSEHHVVVVVAPSQHMGPWGPRGYAIPREDQWREGCGAE